MNTSPDGRDQDRPAYNGSVQRACLAALREPGTVAELAQRLDWPYRRARTWMYQLMRRGKIMRVETVRSASGQHAGRYTVTS